MNDRRQKQQFNQVPIVCVLIFVGLSSLSYFWWSDSWGTVLGTTGRPVGIGFPLLTWHNGIGYELPQIRIAAGVANILIGASVSMAIAYAVVRFLTTRDYHEKKDKISESNSNPQFQFSLKAILISTAVVAIVLALAGPFDVPMIAGLKVVYLAGPLIVAWLSVVIPNSKWRSAIVIGATLGMIVAAGVLSQSANEIRDFTKGLMGVFVCWTPQFALLVMFTMLMPERLERSIQSH